jgi:hypothetical protein
VQIHQVLRAGGLAGQEAAFMRQQAGAQGDTPVVTSDSPVSVCVSFLLAWIAASDGPPGERRRTVLRGLVPAGLGTGDLDALLELAGRGDDQAVLLACGRIKRSFGRKAAERLMEMFTAMALAEGQVSPTARYILEFLADHLGLGSCLSTLHRRLTGSPLPGLADPSSRRPDIRSDRRPRQPRTADGTGQQPADVDGWGRLPMSASDGDIRDRGHALSLLGLTEDSGAEEVRFAFRRLARELHPDHLPAGRRASPGLPGPDATTGSGEQDGSAEVGLRFIRIKKAYEYLRNGQRPV